MLHYMAERDGQLQGWVLPDHPTGTPSIKVFDKNGLVCEVQANRLQSDLRDRGLHETGMIGFCIDEQVVPGLQERLDELEFRTGDSGILIYRRQQEQKHLNIKLFRFDLQVMPDVQAELRFGRRFALTYTNVERYAHETMFGIINNQVATSLYLSGRPSYQRNEQLLRERGFKVITVLRDPYEDLAERLIFMRFAMSPNATSSASDYTYGLDPLKEIVTGIRFDDINSLRTVFRNLDDAQRKALSNPLVRTLTCSMDEEPRTSHIEMSLSKLSRMDLVGTRSRYDDFRSILTEIAGADILEDHQPPTLNWVKQAADVLSEVKLVRSLLAIDVSLFELVKQALDEAIGPDTSASVGRATE